MNARCPWSILRLVVPNTKKDFHTTPIFLNATPFRLHIEHPYSLLSSLHPQFYCSAIYTCMIRIQTHIITVLQLGYIHMIKYIPKSVPKQIERIILFVHYFHAQRFAFIKCNRDVHCTYISIETVERYYE